MRVKQAANGRGSLKWIQLLVTKHADVLNATLRTTGALATGSTIEWPSPRESDDWAEYRDGAFLDRLGRGDIRDALGHFWPRRGPQWDALGRSNDGVLFLVEAKAHLGELRSSCGAKSAQSLELIKRSLSETRTALGATTSADWLNGFYQYTNRLAHLRFLREHGAEAYLLFVYFIGNTGMPGAPISRADWDAALRDLYRHLGLENAQPVPGVINAFIDVNRLIAQ